MGINPYIRWYIKMTNLKLIVFFLLMVIMHSHAQTKQKENKTVIGLAINPTTLIDYNYLSCGSKSIYTFLPEALDVNFNVSKGRQTGVVGTFAGFFNDLPRFYMGYNFRVSPGTWKVDVLVSCKNSVYYKKNRPSSTTEGTFRNIESFLGATIQRTCRRYQFGLSYYAGFHSLKSKYTSGSPSTTYSYSDSGYSRRGLVTLNFNIIIFSRPRP
jgi:hypothetical protein